jgi:glycosyltransferase involved in cell wall biosynthesis
MFNVFGPDLFRRKPLSISACSFSKDADQIGVMLAGDDSNKRRRRYDFVFASRLIEGKGIELLLSALRLCDEAGYSFTIAICGAGPLAGMVRKSEFHNIKLVFLEYVTNMQDVLLDSKVALSLQRHENYPSQFLLEALAANCNIICTDVGDTRLLLDDDISTLIEYDSVRLKAALITTRYDQSLKRRMAVNRTLDKHSVGAFASYIGSLIVNVQK